MRLIIDYFSNYNDGMYKSKATLKVGTRTTHTRRSIVVVVVVEAVLSVPAGFPLWHNFLQKARRSYLVWPATEMMTHAGS